jgi:hypothetical protein
MQIHNYGAGQTIFAFNDWNDSSGTGICDLGIGNYSGTYPDWTFASNATNYVSKLLQVYVLPNGGPPPPAVLTITSSNPGSGAAVTVSPLDNNGNGSGSTPFSRTYNSGTSVSLTAPASAGGNPFVKWQMDGVDYSTSASINFTLNVNHTVNAVFATPSLAAQYVPEAANYSLVYSLNVPNQMNFSSTGVPYDIDNHGSVGAFGRIGYFLQLQPTSGPLQWVWVSMNAFTTDPTKIGVPTIQSGGFFQQFLTNMNVRSSVSGVATGDALGGGNIEFWWANYGKSNGNNVPGASATLYDFGDSASSTDPVGYGSMQVHNWAAGQTIFAFNDWNDSTSVCDLGIGNYSGTYPDWTFAGNATSYSSKILQVYVRPGLPPVLLTINSSNPATGVAVGVSPADLNGNGNGSSSFTRSFANGASVTLSAPSTAGGNNFQKWQMDGSDYSTSANITLALTASHTMTAVYATSGQTFYTLTMASVNPTNGVTLTASVADKNGKSSGSTAFTLTYASGTQVGLTAPATVGGKSFYKWQKNGADYSLTTGTGVTVLGNYTMTAFYESVLTVNSVNPASGVSITVSPADLAQAANGNTSFTRVYSPGTVVNLTAPSKSGSKNFQKWQKDGVDLSTSANISVTLDVNHTLNAVYQ